MEQMEQMKHLISPCAYVEPEIVLNGKPFSIIIELPCGFLSREGKRSHDTIRSVLNARISMQDQITYQLPPVCSVCNKEFIRIGSSFSKSTTSTREQFIFYECHQLCLSPYSHISGIGAINSLNFVLLFFGIFNDSQQPLISKPFKLSNKQQTTTQSHVLPLNSLSQQQAVAIQRPILSPMNTVVRIVQVHIPAEPVHPMLAEGFHAVLSSLPGFLFYFPKLLADSNQIVSISRFSNIVDAKKSETLALKYLSNSKEHSNPLGIDMIKNKVVSVILICNSI